MTDENDPAILAIKQAIHRIDEDLESDRDVARLRQTEEVKARTAHEKAQAAYAASSARVSEQNAKRESLVRSLAVLTADAEARNQQTNSGGEA